jgi:hypothetical protein
MTFRTRLDYSDNRQIKQRERTNTILSGTTVFGVPFSALTSGPDLSYTAQTSQFFGVVSTYSGDSATTVFTWGIPNVSIVDPYISALTPSNSGVSQNISAVFAPSSSTVIDGNLVNLTYSGVSAQNLYPITMIEVSPGNYSGSVSTDFFIFSAETLDFTGRTIWVDNTEILRTKKLIVSNNPQPGYVLTCVDSEGMVEFQPASGSTSGVTLYEVGLGLLSTQRIGVSNLASGDYSAALGGFDNSTTGFYSFIGGGVKNSLTSNYASIVGGSGNSNSLGAVYGFIGGGSDNYIGDAYASVLGGVNNSSTGISSSVICGINNSSLGDGSIVLNGGYNTAIGLASIASGIFTKSYGDSSFIGGSGFNSGRTISVSGESSFAFFHRKDFSGPGEIGVKADYSTILGGINHFTIDTPTSGIFAGSNNRILNNGGRGEDLTIIGGLNNTIDGVPSAAILGGFKNYLSSPTSTILGGGRNSIISSGGLNSIIGGRDCLLSGVSNSTIICCTELTATTDNMVYVPDLTIDGLVGVTDLQTDANGKLVDGSSDIRLKKNINNLNSALNTIINLRGVSFEYTDESNMTPGIRFGFIAQEVQEIVPDLVKVRVKGDGMLTLNYSEIIPWIVEAIKELTNAKTNELIFETQTIAAEDNNIELNYNGTKLTSIGGGITIVNGVSDGINAEFKLNSDGNWITNNSIIPSSLSIPNYTPTSSSDNYGNLGEISVDDAYLYIKGNNGWKRLPLESF